jgi:hypothetical protein
MGAPLSAVAQTQSNPTLLLLRPHCEQATGEASKDISTFMTQGMPGCPNFKVVDPKTQETQALQPGQTLDMDIIVYNPSGKKIEKVRSWLSFDSQVLQGTSITSGSAFSVPTPGEADFSADEGFVKLAASAPDGQGKTDTVIPVARIQFQVLRAPAAGKSPISFYDVQPGLLGHTYVKVTEGTQAKNAVSSDLGSLMVVLQKDGVPASSSSVTSSAVSSVTTTQSSSVTNSTTSSVPQTVSSSSVSSVASSSSSERSPFVLLQVQGLRAGTEGSTLYLSWDVLRSSEIAGYNVYYGTQKGRYIQRHSVPLDTTQHIIRGLLPGTLYYIAVRGVNVRNEESAFSQEVAIRVGDPSSSTSPLSVKPGDMTGPQGQNPLTGSVTPVVNVPGEAGASTTALLILLGSAVIGTAFALRRQYAVAAPKDHSSLFRS